MLVAEFAGTVEAGRFEVREGALAVGARTAATEAGRVGGVLVVP